jgi:hypothetical protein
VPGANNSLLVGEHTEGIDLSLKPPQKSSCTRPSPRGAIIGVRPRLMSGDPRAALSLWRGQRLSARRVVAVRHVHRFPSAPGFAGRARRPRSRRSAEAYLPMSNRAGTSGRPCYRISQVDEFLAPARVEQLLGVRVPNDRDEPGRNLRLLNACHGRGVNLLLDKVKPCEELSQSRARLGVRSSQRTRSNRTVLLRRTATQPKGRYS